MRVVWGTDLLDLLEEVDPVAAVRDVFLSQAEGAVEVPDEASAYWSTRDGKTARTLNMPGMLRGGEEALVVGTKIINSSLANRDRGLPRAAGLTILFDPETARPLCLMEAQAISALRTAAVSVVAIELMASSSEGSVAILGAGAIGACHAWMISERLSWVRRLALYDSNAAAAAELASRLKGSKLQAEVAASASDAVAGAAVVIACTTTTQAYIPASWIAPGMLFVNVSLDDLSAEAILASDRLVVDSWSLVQEDSRRLLGRLARQGLVVGPEDPLPSGGRRIDAEIKDVVVDPRRGRRNRDEVIVVNPFGMSVLDLAIAREVHRLALARGVGLDLKP